MNNREKLIDLRAQAGLNQAKFGELIEYSVDTVKSWECGRRRVLDRVIRDVSSVVRKHLKGK